MYRTDCGPKIECFSCRAVVAADQGRKLGPPFMKTETDFCEGCYRKRLERELKAVTAYSRGE